MCQVLLGETKKNKPYYWPLNFLIHHLFRKYLLDVSYVTDIAQGA